MSGVETILADTNRRLFEQKHENFDFRDGDWHLRFKSDYNYFYVYFKNRLVWQGNAGGGTFQKLNRYDVPSIAEWAELQRILQNL